MLGLIRAEPACITWLDFSFLHPYIHWLMSGTLNNTIYTKEICKLSKLGLPSHPESTFPSTSLVFDIHIIVYYHLLAFFDWLIHTNRASLASTAFLKILPALLRV